MVKQGFVTLSSAMDEADNYTRWIISLFSKHLRGRVLEVGLGHANYRDFLPDLSSYVGSDIDAGVIASARARHPSDRFILIDVCADDFPERLGRGSFDAVGHHPYLRPVQSRDQSLYQFSRSAWSC